MTAGPASRRITALQSIVAPVIRFFTESAYARHAVGDPAVCDFAVGNPHEMPLPEFVQALGKWSLPQHTHWYAYPESKHSAQKVVAASLPAWRGQPFEADDIFMTNGAFAAIAAALNAVVDPGDDVIFVSPPWFFYEALITAAGATPIRVKANPHTFDLDLDAIAGAITPRTRAVIVNSPNNPTGRLYPPQTLEGLARVLAEASARHGRTIYLLSDEAYSRIVYDGRTFHSPTAFYPHSFLLYTYGKTLLTPGQRLGYIALPPAMPRADREALRSALFMAQVVIGYAFPNALLQHALPDLEKLSIDLVHLQHKRDRMVSALREMGYELHVPEGTFYLLPRSPLADDQAFIERLAEHHVFCLPGTLVEMPGYFRISLTANDDMIDRALPGFKAAMEQARRV